MASDASFAQFVVDQINGAGTITTRFMFGEFAVYCNEKVVALICDNKLYVKPTDGGRAYIGAPVEAPAYTGAKMSFLIEDKLEDAKWLTELIRITEREVDAPKPKKTKDSKGSEGTIAKSSAPASPRKATKETVKRPAKKPAKKPATKPAKKVVKKTIKKTAKKAAKKAAEPKLKTRSSRR
jgi:TfoX/Sxy family transcriptional regulator of competence genes